MLVREVEVLKVCVTMGRPHSAEHELCPGDAAPRVCCAHGCPADAFRCTWTLGWCLRSCLEKWGLCPVVCLDVF